MRAPSDSTTAVLRKLVIQRPGPDTELSPLAKTKEEYGERERERDDDSNERGGKSATATTDAAATAADATVVDATAADATTAVTVAAAAAGAVAATAVAQDEEE